jgi:hypothetical protein
MRPFRKFRDDRFALTTLQNPDLEVRTYAELVQAAQQERENQPVAAAIPVTQSAATPQAPDPIPATQSQEMEASTAPDPLPAAPVRNVPDPPGSANPDAASAESRIEAIRQLAARLGIPVVVETRTLPDADVEPISQPVPKPRPKRKSRSKSRGTATPGCASSASSPKNQELEEEDDSALPSIERHSRKCTICRHPERESIDESFLHWRSPATIMHCYAIPSETTIYDHAHAFNLFAQRNRNLQSALANVVEDIDRHRFTGSEMLDAVRALAHLNEDGRWVHPASKSEVVYSMQRLPAIVVPAPQPALPAYSSAPPAEQASLAAVAAQPILISSRPGLENDAND